jgi:hypothetical protein
MGNEQFNYLSTMQDNIAVRDYSCKVIFVLKRSFQ